MFKQITSFLLQNSNPNIFWIIPATLFVLTFIFLIILLKNKNSEKTALSLEIEELKKKEEELTKKASLLLQEKNRILSESHSHSQNVIPENPEQEGSTLLIENKELVFLTKEYLVTDFLVLVKQNFPQNLDFSSKQVDLSYETEKRFSLLLEQLERIEKLATRYSYQFPLDYYQKKMIYALGMRNFGALEEILTKTLSFYPQNKEYHFFHIRLLALMHRDDETLSELESYLEKYPGEIEAREILVNILLRQENYKKAEIECRKMMELKIDVSYKAMLGYIFSLQGFISKAEEIQEELHNIPENSQAQFYLGLMDELRGKNKEALTRYQKLYQSGNRDQDILARLITLNAQISQSAQNRKIFEDIRNVATLDAETCISYIRTTEFSHNDFISLSEMIKTICDQRVKDFRMYDALGELMLNHQNLLEARNAFQKSHEIYPSGKDALMQLAQLDLDDKNLDSAKDRIDQLKSKWPTDAKIRILLGVWNTYSGDEEASRKILADVHESHPGKMDLYPSLGKAYMKLKDFKEALYYFIRLEDSKQKSETLFRDMAYCYYGLNQLDDALSYYHKILEINSKNLDAYNNIGVIHSERAEFKKAKKYFHEALQINPESVQTNYNLALLYKKINQENSVKYYAKYKELIKEGTTDGQIH